MKILYVINDIDFFISHRLPLAEHAISKNYEVFVASNALPKTKTPGVTFLKFEINRSSVGIITNFNSLIQLNKIIKKVSPEIVHSVTIKSIVISNLCLIFNRKIKKVNAVSGLGFLFTSDRKSFSLSIIKSLFHLFNIVNKPYYIFQNENDLQKFKKLRVKDNYKLIKGSGVNHKKFEYNAPIKKDKINITFTGRILKDKGILDLIKAIQILPKEFREKITLNIYGKLDQENPSFISKNEFNNLLIPGFILWHGFTKNIKKVLVNSDIYCLPSYREGLPKSILEAMAIGRPILTTNAPGCDETVEEGINGFKVDVTDYSLLSEKLRILIQDESLRIEMGKRSREIFEENFTLDKVVNETFKFYEKIIF